MLLADNRLTDTYTRRQTDGRTDRWTSTRWTKPLSLCNSSRSSPISRCRGPGSRTAPVVDVQSTHCRQPHRLTCDVPPASSSRVPGAVRSTVKFENPVYLFSMTSPPNFAEERAPRLSAMGGRAGCNPDNPLKLPTKYRLLAAWSQKCPIFGPPLRRRSRG